MSETIIFPPDEMIPDREAVFALQGIPASKSAQDPADSLCTRALGLLAEVAAPAAILAEISASEFETVYRGEGRNQPHTPVGDICRRADSLALFAVTLGEQISRSITERFGANDFALGSMLDSAASAAADKLAELAEARFVMVLGEAGRLTPDAGVLSYSPGYCGWHVSGQKRLFEFLRPGQIGISLRESFLMQPLKSVSGVIIAGSKEIHRFEDTYDFCDRCAARGCRARIRGLFA